jgi:molecular chaperone GrpE (heat shock protein)
VIQRWLSALVGRSAVDAGQAETLERLDRIERRLASLSNQAPLVLVDEQVSAEIRADLARVKEGLAALQPTLVGLDKTIGRAGREQFKANALTETQITQFQTTLAALQTADARREATLAEARDQYRAGQAAARLDVARALLPALDGLDEALRSGKQILNEKLADKELPPPSFFQRVQLWLAPPALPPPTDPTLVKTMAAWLAGLTFVRDRLLAVLAAEGVYPMPAEGEPFDPQLHVVVEVTPVTGGLPPGTVTAEIRRGYTLGDRVLRLADVAVSGETP